MCQQNHNIGKKGFTLIELLVVIAIIALLLSILMPSLRKVKNQAYEVVCRSNLKQWGSIYLMYIQDYNGSFMPGWVLKEGMWMNTLKPYYQTRKICMCPKVKKLVSDGTSDPGRLVGWGEYGHPRYYNGYIPPFGVAGDYGSYGVNGWMHNPPASHPDLLFDMPPERVTKFWRKMNVVRNASSVPMFADAVWDGTIVENLDLIPEVEGTNPDTSKKWGIWNFFLNRHNGGINMVFADLSTRKVGLKELPIDLDWHKGWEKRRILDSEWPDWINKL